MVLALLTALSCENGTMLENPQAPEEPPRIEIGKPFPDLVLPSLADGRPMSLRQFRGRKVLLHVFASW